ncbi:HDOD domain-containing protein [Stutzerimonas urumqiensis]|uniref:HDOD domain-containing protein n=1 Tax=Stutzerimonas urumqiensis TaxID=638269 RepID=UPI003BACB9F1
MTTPHSLPRTLPAWAEALDAVRLPVVTVHHEKVRRALGDGSRSMRDIAETIQASPVLALYVLREANRSGNALMEKAESLEVALSRLGLARVSAMLSQIPSVKPEAVPAPLRQLLLISQHASQQANGLFASRLARLWQDIHWGSLLFLAPVWALVALRPDFLKAWEQRVFVAAEPVSRVEHDLLGVPLLELCRTVAERWRLPDWIVEGYQALTVNRRLVVKALHIARDNEHPLHQQQLLDADPPLRRWVTQPGNTIVLANGLAIAAHHSWSGIHTLRWQRLAGLYLQLALPELQQRVHQQAVQSARESSLVGLWHPALALPMPWDSRFQVPDDPTPRPAQAPSAEWRALCAELLREPTPFGNALQLTATACRALAAIGFSRALILQADRNHSRLVAMQTLGLDKDAAAMTLDPSQSQLIGRLLEKPLRLTLTAANMAQFSALLPGAVKTAFPSDHLLLRSVALNGRVLLLVVADQQGQPFDERSAAGFDKTLQCLERALLAFSRRPR